MAEKASSQKGYQPIENYGIIGDLNTVALVGLNGSIDFMCMPDFDSPTVFARLLDSGKGGSFQIHPTHDHINYKQLYLPDTNILITRFLSEKGVGELTDFMPVQEQYRGKELARRVTSLQGELTYYMKCSPKFNYAQSKHKIEQVNDFEVIFKSEGSDQTRLRLKSNIHLTITKGSCTAEFTLKTGERADFLLVYVDKKIPEHEEMEDFISQSLYDTINYWKSWISQSNYTGRWREIVNRSALVLKLMTSFRYGSLVAAPTFGLPEEIGGVRNWDYRYTWIRDASFTIYVFLKLGYTKEAAEFIKWVEKKCLDIEEDETLQLMYTLAGGRGLTEKELPHLEGYRHSKPVRIGNGAYEQVQLDIYGELMDSVYLYDKYTEPIAYNLWISLSKQIDWVCHNWKREDEGIWEVRGGKKHFLYSRLMCWVALDRAVKIADIHSFPLPKKWIEERDKIFYSIHHDFWNEKLQSFVQYKGAETVDAATLLMPLSSFISPKDPKWLSTMKCIEDRLVSDSLIYRYRNNQDLDGLKGGEGTFSMCTFWYVECLARAGELDKARLFFEKMLGYANHLGLYAEQLGIDGKHLGNFPQAFTHLGLISAAISLDDQLNDKRNKRRD